MDLIPVVFFIMHGVLSLQSECVIRHAEFQDVKALEGYNITSSVLDVTSRNTTKGTINCASECFMLDNCLSFFYNSITNQCQFHTEVFLANAGATIQSGTVYFYQVGHEVQDDTASSTATPLPCPNDDGFQMLGSDEMFVKFHTDLKTWSDANATCASYSPNGHLAVVNTEAKNNLVKNAGILLTPCLNDAVFFGLTAEGWVDGSPLVFTFWASGVTHGSNECASFQRHIGWRWNSMDCTALRHYVCQIPL